GVDWCRFWRTGLPDAVAAARLAGEMNDGSPVRVGLGQPFQNAPSVRVAALSHQLVHRQAGVASINECLYDVELGQRKNWPRLARDDGLLGLTCQDHRW